MPETRALNLAPNLQTAAEQINAHGGDMKKFILLAHGQMDHTPEFREAHMRWWAGLQPHVVDAGNPLANGRDMTRDGSVSAIADPATMALGYSIIEVESEEVVDRLLADCPMDVWVYEAMPTSAT